VSFSLIKDFGTESLSLLAVWSDALPPADNTGIAVLLTRLVIPLDKHPENNKQPAKDCASALA